MPRFRSCLALAALLAAGAAPAAPLAAQYAHIVTRDSVLVVPGARYRAGGVERFILGDNYRELWTTPLWVPLLDLERTGGGLTATRRGGGQQTKTVRFQAATGAELVFRSLDKDPAKALPAPLRDTPARSLIRDQTSSAHPAGPLVAAAALEAVGVAHATPVLVVLPSSPKRLGSFNDEFAGMLGYVEPHPNEGSPLGPGQPYFSQVIGTESLFRRLDMGDRVDAAGYLAARLADFLLGDWDRHSDQWRWGRRGAASPWEPIPRDRDQALVRFDGVMLDAVRATFLPKLVEFGDDIPVAGLAWNARDLDRRILPALREAQWDSVAAAVVGRLDDRTLDRIVAAVPAAYGADHRRWVREMLRSRRDGLREAATEFRERLAGVRVLP